MELMGFTFLCMTAFLGNSFGGNLSVVSFMGYSYWLAAAVRNKQMHILNGNSPSAPFSLHVCNINGLQQAGRWEFITDHLNDFMAITETHATVLVQTGLEKKIGGSNYGIIWDIRSRTVVFLVLLWLTRGVVLGLFDRCRFWRRVVQGFSMMVVF